MKYNPNKTNPDINPLIPIYRYPFNIFLEDIPTNDPTYNTPTILLV